MSSIDALVAFFDKAKDFAVKMAVERDEERARNTDLETLLKASEEERDRERRDRLKLLEDFTALEERARKLERDNAVLFSQGEQIVAIWNSGGQRIADSSDLKPEQITRPRPAADDQLEKDFEEIGRALAANRPMHPALNDKPRPPMMEGVVQDIANSSEAQPKEPAEPKA